MLAGEGVDGKSGMEGIFEELWSGDGSSRVVDGGNELFSAGLGACHFFFEEKRSFFRFMKFMTVTLIFLGLYT